MPNRILREGIIESERINSLSPEAELFYRRLMSKADDYGRFHGHPALILAACYPLQLDLISQSNVSEWLAECAHDDRELVIVYEVSGKTYLQISNFGQRTRTDSKFPAPCAQNVREMLAQCRQDDGPSAAHARARSESESDAKTNAETDTGAAIIPFGPLDSLTFERDRHVAWQWFISVYPGDLNENFDSGIFVSVIQTFEDIRNLRTNLPAWMECQKWAEGYIEKAENFLRKRMFNTRPKARDSPRKEKGVTREQLAVLFEGDQGRRI